MGRGFPSCLHARWRGGKSRARAFLPPGEFQSILVPPLSPPFRSIPYTRRRAKGPRARSCTKSTISCEGMVKLASNSANLSRICRMQARFEPSNSSFLYYLGNCTQFLRNLSSFLYKLPGREERRGGDACRRPSPIRAQGKKGSKDGDGEKEREVEERPRLLHPPQPMSPSSAATSRQKKPHCWGLISRWWTVGDSNPGPWD